MPIQTHLPHLPKPQATVLALGSRGMVLARSWALTAVRAFLATWLGRKENPVRQPWRACGSEATANRGPDRCARRVETCCMPLLAWVGSVWQGPQWALALAATPLGTRLTVWVLRVVERGGAIPVVWVVLSATATQAWRREWWRRRRQVHRAVPRSWTVLVLAARGLYARWRFRRLTRLGWPPFVRIHTGGTFRPKGQGRGVALKTVGPEPGPTWQGTGLACTGRHRQRPCPLLARWEAGDKDPWLLLPALPPEARTACWEGLRAWMAQGFQLTKRGGWQGHQTHMTTPERAARRGLAVAVATLWLRRVGGEAEETIPCSPMPDLTALVPAPRRTRRGTRRRLLSVLRRGWHLLLVAWRDQVPRPMGRFVPAPWPAVPEPEEPALRLPALEVPLAA